MAGERPLSLWGKPAPSPKDMPIWTSYQLAEYLDTNVTNVQRWCRKWFGDLGKGRNVGRAQGYPIPWQYVYVARTYLLVEDDRLRNYMRDALVKSPRDWVTVVDGVALTHYTIEEAARRAAELRRVACIVYAGEFRDRIIEDGQRP